MGIFAGYVANTIISHNEIDNLPYTGISLGWGWGTADSDYAQNNRIQNNRIYNYMQILSDGGGIYTLGKQGNPTQSSTVSANYISNQGNNFGALYFDEGSAYFEANNNVLSSVPLWLHIWTGSIHDINVHDNYSDTPNYTNQGSNITLNNNYTQLSSWPDTAQTTINNAGLEPNYQDIKQHS